ncbi:hypothetical protein [Neoroseomonas soli]|uniref:PH domain-containing protein n=1 Tax=Neoroseomonas soli TaxID=1081025 RepID=A0A9X9WZE6_9PROT|nr:hypothetical protein [Neoroseomonas soli]MBR0672525.1 hypothetical protein [Neoroseomonas soli]
MNRSAPGRFEAREARWKFVLGLVFFLGCLLVGAATTAVATGLKLIVAWAVVGCSLIFCIIGIARILGQPRRVIIDRSGMLDERLTGQVVPWNAIEAARLMNIRGNRFITMRIRSPERFRVHGGLDWPRGLKRAMGELDFTLNPTNLNQPSRKVIAAFEQHYAAALGFPPW